MDHVRDLTLSPEELASQILENITPNSPLDPRSLGLLPLLEGRDLAKCQHVYEIIRDGSADALIKARAQAEILGVVRRDPDVDVTPIIDALVQTEMNVVNQGNIDKPTAGYLSGVNYNQGIALRGPCRYVEAGQAQARSAIWALAAGEPPTKAMTALFIQAVEEATESIDDPKHGKIRRQNVTTLRATIQAACATLGVPYPGWMAANADVHVWLLHCWAGEDYPEREADEESILSRAEKSPQFAACVQVSRLIRSSAYAEAIEAADQALERFAGLKSSSATNVLLTLQLLKARAYMGWDTPLEADRIYNEIVEWKGPDGGGVKAAVDRDILRNDDFSVD